MDAKTIMIAPVSGGYFVNQLAIMYRLAELNFKPDIIMAASGGVVASTILMSSNYDQVNMIRVAKEIRSNIYIKSWIPETLDFIPSKVVGIFRGSLYNSSDNLKNVMKQMVSPAILRETEMWISTFNVAKSKPGLYCTCSSEKAIIKDNTDHKKLYDELIYIDGDIDLFTKVACASASIPSVLPPVEINGENHVDGGVDRASPISALAISVQRLDRWHMVYVCCKNMYQNERTDLDGSFIDTVRFTISAIINCNIKSDAYKCYELLAQRGEVIEEKMDLKTYFSRRDEWFSSLIELYPINDNMLDLSNFNGDDVVQKMLEIEFEHKVWYVVTKSQCFAK